jgi:hypothetical protein
MTHGEEPREEFRNYMKAVNRTADTPDDRHLSEARMLAYYRGDMSEAERELAQDHLVGCEQCIALFRSAADFLEPAGANDESVNVAETNEAWLSLLQRVEIAPPKKVGDAGTTVVRAEFQRPRDRKFLLDSRITLAMAACLLISFGTLGLLGWRLRQERESRRQSQEAALQLERKQRELEQRLSQVEQSGADQVKRERDQRLAAEAERDQLQSLLASVQPERAVIPVYPFTLSSERGSAEDLSLSFKKGVSAVKVRLFRSKPYEFPEYAIELVDQRGQVVRQISGLRPARADGALSLQFNRATFEAGKYNLRLFGKQGTTRQPLGEYGVNITLEK